MRTAGRAGRMRRGSPALALALAAPVLLSGCASLPFEIPESWLPGGEGKWASAVGQEPNDLQEPQDAADPPAAQDKDTEDAGPAPLPQEPEDRSNEAVAQVQRKLAVLGYEPGPTDGIVGPATQAAIRHYQKDAGMTEDGMVSDSLIARLDGPPPQRIEPAPKQLVIGYLSGDIMPEYAAGDTYVWSSGSIEQVVRVRDDTIWWSRNDGAQYSTQRSFILPMLQWKKPTGAGRTATGMDAAGAWPTDDGAPLTFTVHETGGRESMAQEWTCQRAGRGTTIVPAGVFRTVTIACERTGAAPGAWRRRVWQYAPAVRFYVRRDDFVGASDEPIRSDLIAVRLGAEDWPPVARDGLDQAIQKSLDAKKPGKQTRWKSTAVEDRFVIQMTGEAKRYGWDRCRTYLVERMTPDSPRAWPGLACRDSASGRWLTPLLEEQRGTAPPVPIN